MKSLSLNKIYLISFLIGGMVTLALYALGANANTNSNSLNFSLNLFVDAGMDVTICDNDNFQTNGISSFMGVTKWKTNGDGVFENPYDLQTVYFPGEHDIAAGKVKLSLIVSKVQANDYKFQAGFMDSMILSFGDCVDPGPLPR
jgi:hypothetical protein